jgi:RecB family endonuclease NucS
MGSAYSRPILIGDQNNVIVLERVPLTGSAAAATYTEKWLQKLLYRHPEALPVTEINETFSSLIPVCRELNTPAGPIDVLYVTPQGRIAVLEAKL